MEIYAEGRVTLASFIEARLRYYTTFQRMFEWLLLFRRKMEYKTMPDY